MNCLMWQIRRILNGLKICFRLIMGEYERAVEAWEELIRELETEWNITEGEAKDRPLMEIARLKE